MTEASARQPHDGWLSAVHDWQLTHRVYGVSRRQLRDQTNGEHWREHGEMVCISSETSSIFEDNSIIEVKGLAN